MTKKTEEQKKDDFSRLASYRTSNALEDMRLIKQLANPIQYDWTEEQEATIFSALEAQLEEMRKAFGAVRNGGEKKGKHLAFRV